ncbi:MAG: general secretion pathway protein GspK [Myxococcales bacterium]|jgi:general secretion pathway protein K|nr:general secretion pathway protein GspK [Myxococcales bacterium]
MTIRHDQTPAEGQPTTEHSTALEKIWAFLNRPLGGRRVSRKRLRRERGVAMLLVVTSIAIMTSVAIDFQFNASVDLQLAANARDELRAEYLARSAVNVGRLVLMFQRQLDGQAGSAGSLLQGLGLGGGAGASLNFRLWEIVPIDCGVLTFALGGGLSGLSSDKPAFDTGVEGNGLLASFGDFEGCFSATIEDEEQKLNVNRLNMGSVTGLAPMLQMRALLNDLRFEFVFEREDAHKVKMLPDDVLIALHDWIDDGETQATLNLTGTGDPFPDGFSDENRNYMSHYPVRYRSKNAAFDTLDELYQVDGIGDLFMTAFRERLTVYPDKNKLLNINTSNQEQILLNIFMAAENENDPKLRDLLTLQNILMEIAQAKVFSFIGMSTSQFVSIIENNGVAVKAALKGKNNKWITDKSETFTIEAIGQAGRVEKRVTAVVRSDSALGKILYFRQE